MKQEKCTISQETKDHYGLVYTVTKITVPESWELWEEPDFEGEKL